VTGVVAAAGVTAAAWWYTENQVRTRAVAGLAQIEGTEASGAFLGRRLGTTRVKAQVDPAEVARRYLAQYGVFGPGDWHRRDEVRGLPAPDRGELEAWLLEQSLRYAHSLGSRPGSPGDWRRAADFLDRVTSADPYGALLGERQDLRRRLGKTASNALDVPEAPLVPWVEEYLLGVAAELAGDLETAAERYQAALRWRPGSFWGNYRAASVASARLSAASARTDADAAREHQLITQAANHLKVCVDQRPENPILRRQYAGCLYLAGRYSEALQQCDRAQSLDLDHPDTYVTLLFLGLKLGRMTDFLRNLAQYDVLTGHRPQAGQNPAPALDLTGALDQGSSAFDLATPGPRGARDDADEILARTPGIAELLRLAGNHEQAIEQYDRVLELEPTHLLSRYLRAASAHALRRPDARRHYALVAEHPQVEALVRAHPTAMTAFHYTTRALASEGRWEEAVSVARRGLEVAERCGLKTAGSYYCLAQAYAAAAKFNRSFSRQALDSLDRAYALEPHNVPRWFAAEPLFDDLRAEYGPSPFGRY
jgi:tetratricopeptide (TPR) repeat protein